MWSNRIVRSLIGESGGGFGDRQTCTPARDRGSGAGSDGGDWWARTRRRRRRRTRRPRPASRTPATCSTDFRMGYVDDIDFQANIFASYNATPYFIFTEVYDLLLNYDVPTGAPDLKNSPAYKYKVSKDGLTITYWMHKNMKWSDGKPFTSADVVWSYEHAADSNVNSTATENMKSITALSPTVVQIKMKRYDARILSAFVPIVPKHIWAPHGASSAKLTHFNPCCPMVGSGPFTVQSINPNGTSILVPNKYFYRKQATARPYQADPADQVRGRGRRQARPPAGLAGCHQQRQHQLVDAVPQGEERQVLVDARAGLRRDRVQHVPAQGLAQLHRPGAQRQRAGRAGCRHPPGDQLRHRPKPRSCTRLQRHLPAGHRHHLAVLRAARVLHHLQGRSQHLLHLRPRKGPPGAGAGRLEVPPGGGRRDLYQERPEGRVHPGAAIERLPAAAGRAAGPGRRQGGRASRSTSRS